MEQELGDLLSKGRGTSSKLLKAVSVKNDSSKGQQARTTTQQKCAAVPRRVRIYGSETFASLNSRLESNKEEQKG